MQLRVILFGLLGIATATGCQPVDESTSEHLEDVQSSSDELCWGDDDVDVDSSVFTTVSPPIPSGIAAFDKVVFYASPLDGRVVALSRATGNQIAELTPPPGGFTLPLILHAIGPTRLAILDSGGFPEPGVVDAEPRIFEYEHTYEDGIFDAYLDRTVSFTGKKIGFAEEFVYLGNGRYLVPDSVYGSIWKVRSDGTVEPGIVPKTFDPDDAIPQMVYCPTMPQITVGGLPFLFTGSTIPGVASIAKRGNTVYFYSSCAGGLYKFPYSILSDGRPPWKRANDIKLIAQKSPNVPVEQLLEMQFNPYDPFDKYLYAADSLQLRLIRIDPQNGERQVLDDDPYLFNFPSALAFLPPKYPGSKTRLLVMSNQQHRDPLLNPALTSDLTQPPYVITKVEIDD
jgi:hypothetical protein